MLKEQFYRFPYLYGVKRPLLYLFIVILMGCMQLRAQDSINWMSFPELEAAMANEARPVFIDFYTDWCGWCKRMDKSTFKEKEVVNYLNANFYAVKFDAEEKKTITYKGKEFKFVTSGRRGYNELAAAYLRGQMSYPTYVVLEDDFDIITAIKGYQTSQQLMPMLTYLGEKHYLDQQWEDFLQSWKPGK